MDKRQISGILVTLVAIAIFYAVRFQVEKKHPEWAVQLDKQQQPATQPATTEPIVSSSTTSPSAIYSGSTTGPSIGAVAGLHARATTQPVQAVTLGSAANSDPTYAMQLALTPSGAGVESVTLNQFRQSGKGKGRYVFERPYADQSESSPLATRSVTVNGFKVDLSGDWQLASSSTSSATFIKDIVDGDTPVLRIARTFTLPERNTPSAGYEIQANYAFQNLSNKPLSLQTSFNGPTVPPKEVERGADRQLIMGYQEPGNLIKVSQTVVEGIKAEQDLSKKDNMPAVWGGTGSVYFGALVLPGAPGSSAADHAVKTDYTIVARSLTPDDPERHDILMTFTSGSFELAAGQTASLPLSVFLGPKQRDLLKTSYYASYPREFSQTLVIPSSYCAICTFSWLINVLVAMLTAFHWVFRDWGLAIICLVVLVRICLHPITKRSQIQMLGMGKMGPEIERLKAKYGDNKDQLNKAMMQVYKEQGMAPILGCLPMFLQMPIWIALWSALQSTFELRQSPFLWFGPVHLTWISDLANPDALLSWTPFKLPILGDISSLNLLPILMGVVFFMQQKYTPKPVAATPEQAQQQKMMTWMSTALFPLFLYKSPAGLNLYIFASTTYGIIESKIIRRHIKEREELEKKQRTIIEAKPTRGNRNRGIDEPEPPKKTGIMGWLAQLQDKADQIKREQK